MKRTSLVAALCVLASCVNPQRPAPQTPAPSPAPAAAVPENGYQPTQGASPQDAPTQGAPPTATPATLPAPIPKQVKLPTKDLSDKETKELLTKLPNLTKDPKDETDFSMRDKTQRPPRGGKEIKEPFPLPDGLEKPPAPEVVKEPLTVLRHAPEGEIPWAAEISVTFSQPMVDVTSLEEIEKMPVPIKMTPAVPGKWKWAGARTVVFEPLSDKGPGRLPLATDFTLEIPAGTKSALGNALAKTEVFTFSTPPNSFSMVYPYQGSIITLTPTFLLSFAQRVDPKAVLATIEVSAPSYKGKLELVSEEEIKKDPYLSGYAQQPNFKEMWLAFKVTNPLPKDAAVTVKVGPGVPSLEGPRTTKTASTFPYKTFGPMRFISAACSYGGPLTNCHPDSYIYAGFTNSIDATKFTKEMAQISPAVENFSPAASGSQLYMSGTFKEETKYTIKISKKLTDLYGQTLEKDETITFTTGKRPPPVVYNPKEQEIPKTLTAELQGFYVLDPAAKPVYKVYTQGINSFDVSLYEVSAKDWQVYQKFLSNYYNNPDADPPGKEVWSKRIRIDKSKEPVLQEIDLSPALQKTGVGQVFVKVTSKDIKYNKENYYNYYYRPTAWVEVTQIGLDASYDQDSLNVLVTSLQSGKPLEGVEVSLLSNGSTQKSNKSGMVTLALPKESSMLVARKGKDEAFWPGSFGPGYDLGTSLQWYVFDDRKMYRPKEEVKIKGFIRQINWREGGDTGLASLSGKKMTFSARDVAGLEIAKGETTINGQGGFDISIKLPETPNLGYAYVSFALAETSVAPASYAHSFQIQEFRRAEYEVTTSAAPGEQFVDGEIELLATAKYYSGSALPEADVAWSVAAYQTSFTPPGHSDFYFGTFIPWWGYYNYYNRGGYYDDGYYGGGYYGGYYGYYPAQSFSFTGKTDAAGQHIAKVKLAPTEPPRAMLIQATATVQDINRQAWSSSTSFTAHPSAYYVGLKAEKYFVQEGQALNVESLVVDVQGKEVSGIVYYVTATLPQWVYDKEKNQYVQKEIDKQTCKLTSSQKPGKCSFVTKGAGQYQIVAEVFDQKERKNQSQLTLWSAGQTPYYREYGVTQGQVTLIQDKKEYKIGDTAEILVQAPFSPAEGVVTWRRSGIIKTERISIPSSGVYTLKVPIEEAHTPNLYVQVDLVGVQPRLDEKGQPQPKLPPKPAYAVGQAKLSIPPKTRTLSVAVTPAKKVIAPGEKTSLKVSLKDSKGSAVPNAEVALVVVDEAVLALTNYQLLDPISLFYPERQPGGQDQHFRSYIRLEETKNIIPTEGTGTGAATKAPTNGGAPMPAPTAADEMDSAKPTAPGAKGGTYGGVATPPPPPAQTIDLRTNFDALALFLPAEKTNANGETTVDFTLPDNLTRYRVMAVAVSGQNRFGTGESSITARKPLMVRPSPPRFMNYGDQLLLPVVVENQTDSPLTIQVVARGTNTTLENGKGLEVTLPANSRTEVSFPVAPTAVGKASFQIAAISGAYSDASEFSLPVYTPATTEAFATYGTIDKGAIVQPVSAPKDVFTAFGGVKVTTSSTAVAELTDAVLYVYLYPYECAEQLSSKLVSIAALKDVLAAFDAEGLPSEAEIHSSVKEIMTRLRQMQKADGGFGFWSNDRSWPYVSVHVTHALARAKQKGFTVPPDMLARAQSYLQNIESHYDGWYGKDTMLSLSAYALYTRNLLGDTDVKKAQTLISKYGGAEKMNLEAIGWLMPVLKGSNAKELEDLRRVVNSRATETAGEAHFVTSYNDQNYLMLYSDRRVDGILLDALIGDNPKSDIIPKLVRGLLNHRTQGRWYNTQENAFSLLALDRYFGAFEKETPSFVARVWLGETYAGETEFQGRSTEQRSTEIPMSVVQQGKPKKDLIISKEGEGRLYYRIGMSYAPKNLRLTPLQYGFTVTRTYEAIDNPSDVKKDKDGVWHIKAGAKVRVKVSMATKSRRYHVALVDPMPAGFEALNPALLTTAPIPQDPSMRGWWYGQWFEHQNLRDERAEAFTSYLYEGVYEYSYVARATTLGTFIAPPAKAEEMYSPEIFGRSATDIVIVE